MESLDTILQYFPGLTEPQKAAFGSLQALYADWNSKINVISRRDIDNLYSRHILHSLAIAKFMTPAPGTRLLDLGTGGGFPGIPLAIMWPECSFHLIDRIGKKINVARSVSEAIGLSNVTFQHGDAGECHEKFDYVVSRAVMGLDALVATVRKNIKRSVTNTLPPGVICLKGGDLSAEIEASRRHVLEVPLTDWFHEPFFETKKLIYVNL